MAKAKAAKTLDATPAVPALAIFNTSVDASKLKRRNMPQMIKPEQVPIGQTVSGEIVDVLPSPVSTIKGNLLWLRHETGTEYTFPVTGVIRQALAPGKHSEEELLEVLKKEIGKTFIATRGHNRPSKFKKEMFMFDVFTSDK